MKQRQPVNTRDKLFRSYEEFFSSARTATMTEHTDPRLMAAVGSDEQSGASDPYGGFLLPKEVMDVGLSASLERGDFIGQRTTHVRMPESNVRVAARVDKDHTTSVSGGLVASRRPETLAATVSRMEIQAIDLEATSLIGVSYGTEMLTGGAPLLRPMLEAGFRAEMGSKLLQERLYGAGQSAGEFLGITKSAALITIAKEGGQSADTITHANLLGMKARCWGYDKAIWISNHDCSAQLLAAADSNGNLAWSPGDDDVPDRLLGRPLIFSEYAKTLGDLYDIFLVTWAEYLEGEHEPFQGLESIHVRWSEHQRVFKFWTRNAGAPWWTAALTPKNGASTLSPYLTLAVRA